MAKKQPTFEVSECNRIQPRLRVFANGSSVVSAVRAEHCSGLVVSDRIAEEHPTARGRGAAPVEKSEIPRRYRPRRMMTAPGDVQASVFVEMSDESALENIPGCHARSSNLVTARMSLAEVNELAKDSRVARIDMGDPLTLPDPAEGGESEAPPDDLRNIPYEELHRYGDDVLIGVVDVGGFDFAHPDFLVRGRTRFQRIWDQGGNARPSPFGGKLPQFAYGAEFHKRHLDAAIKASRGEGLLPWEIERQSRVAFSSHGTHVASIAAGNSGICRKAKIAGVLISIPDSDLERRKSFYDSTCVLDAVAYLFRVADDLGCKAVSINISLGTNGHAHDASSAVSRWIDHTLSTPGRCISVAAGNAGQEDPTQAGDVGFIMGRIHTSGRLAQAGLNDDIGWVVVGNQIADLSENELEIWYSSQDRLAVFVRPPGGSWLGPVEAGDFIENQQLDDGTFVSIYNELYHPANGSNHIGIFLSPFLSPAGVVGVKAGTWTVRLHGSDVRDGHYHGWIERDDPRPIGPDGDVELWRFPSFFTRQSNVDRSSVSSLACGHRVISVANLDSEAERINPSSSQGPSRDGRAKPEVCAPGTDVVAAKGFAVGGAQWVEKTGTSMASPYVAGVIGLMLRANPSLTAAQIGGIIKRTAHPLPGNDYEWRDDAGYGRIDPGECVLEANRIELTEDTTR
jgi:subtilisin family serine protease